MSNSAYEDQPRPEPVLEETAVVQKVVGVATGLLTIGVVAGVVTLEDQEGLVASLAALAGAVVTVVNIVVPRVRALRARAKVTPISDPRTS